MSARVALARAALVLAAGGVAACKAKPAPALSASGALPDSAEQVMFGMRHVLTNNGVRRAVLFADTGFFYDDGNVADLRRVRIVFFSVAGDSNAVLTGRTGRYDARQRRVDGRGDVVVTSTDGRRLTSPHLVYDQNVNQITSDTNFTFTEPGRTLSGVGLRTDPQLHNVTVLRQARGRTEVKGTELPKPTTPAAPGFGAPPGTPAGAPRSVPAGVPSGTPGGLPTSGPPAGEARPAPAPGSAAPSTQSPPPGGAGAGRAPR